MKNKKIEVLIKILVPVVVIGGCFGVEKVISVQKDKSFNKAVVVESCDISNMDDNEGMEIESRESYGDVKGLSQNFGFINNDEVLLAIGLSQEEFLEKYPQGSIKEDSELLDTQLNDEYGKMYVYNLKNFSKTPLGMDARDVYSDFVSGVNRCAYSYEDKMSMLDLNTNSKIKDIDSNVFMEEDMQQLHYIGQWSKDGSTFINYCNGNLITYNIEEDSIKEIKIDKDDIRIATTPSYYSEDGNEIYYIGVKCDEDDRSYGIYKANVDENTIEEILSLPANNGNDDYNEQSHIGQYYVLDNGKRIIFSGNIKGVNGVYIYDIDNSKYYNVIPTTVEDRVYWPTIWISPDKNKIIYINLVKIDGKEQMNLYAAKINGNSLTDRICIYKDIELRGFNVSWSSDSKKILFFTTDGYTEKNYTRFANKNEINIITFK